MNQYYGVVGFFCASMAGAAIYTFLNPPTSFATTPIIDDNNILVHNGQDHMFSQGRNEFFGVSRVMYYTVELDN